MADDARTAYWRRHHERLRDLALGEKLDREGNWRGTPEPFFADVVGTIEELIYLARQHADEIAALRAKLRSGRSGASSVGGSGA